MFRRHGFFRFLLIGFLMISLFGLIRGSSYRSGWAQGFAAGRTAVDTPTSEDAPAATHPPTYHGPHGYWGGGHISPFFWIVGSFFKFALFLFFLALLFKLFRFGRGRHWHHHHKAWKHHKEWKHHHHNHTPPWYDDSSEEPIMKA